MVNSVFSLSNHLKLSKDSIISHTVLNCVINSFFVSELISIRSMNFIISSVFSLIENGFSFNLNFFIMLSLDEFPEFTISSMFIAYLLFLHNISFKLLYNVYRLFELNIINQIQFINLSLFCLNQLISLSLI